ncbi:MAG TPA: hypothetical protein VMW28_05555 [Pelolinea sp.]|nr:hypothetical protein [Pelolinea sp.]
MGVLAHSTHLKGAGTYENGVETPRINVILATGVPEETCHQINLNYLDHDQIQPGKWENCLNEGLLYIKNAGETLYKFQQNS